MKLPWLQVDGDVMSKATALASVLGLKKRDTLGLLNLLWAGALSWGRHEEPPDGIVASISAHLVIAGWCEWEGDPSTLIQGLIDCGFIEPTPSGVGFRVRGMSRYLGTWNKNRGIRTGPERKPNGKRTETEAPELDVDTEVEKKKKHVARATPPPPPPPAPGWKELVDSICNAYSELFRVPYAFKAKDGVALSQLRGLTPTPPDSYILAVWRHALATDVWPKVRSVPALASRWNDCVANYQRPAGQSRGVALLAIDRPRTA